MLTRQEFCHVICFAMYNDPARVSRVVLCDFVSSKCAHLGLFAFVVVHVGVSCSESNGCLSRSGSGCRGSSIWLAGEKKTMAKAITTSRPNATINAGAKLSKSMYPRTILVWISRTSIWPAIDWVSSRVSSERVRGEEDRVGHDAVRRYVRTGKLASSLLETRKSPWTNHILPGT